MKPSNKKLNFVIDYALCYLHASWNDQVQEDLDMSYEEFIKVISEFQGKEIKVEQYTNE